jgi:hypothetical protein
MSDRTPFDVLSEAIEAHTTLNRLESRGTVRIALKEAGLDARSVTASQLVVVIERLLPRHFQERGIPDPEAVCRTIAAPLAGTASAEASESPEAIFSRLGG